MFIQIKYFVERINMNNIKFLSVLFFLLCLNCFEKKSEINKIIENNSSNSTELEVRIDLTPINIKENIDFIFIKTNEYYIPWGVGINYFETNLNKFKKSVNSSYSSKAYMLINNDLIFGSNFLLEYLLPRDDGMYSFETVLINIFFDTEMDQLKYETNFTKSLNVRPFTNSFTYSSPLREKKWYKKNELIISYFKESHQSYYYFIINIYSEGYFQEDVLPFLINTDEG